ncbi:MAG TPA: hypothetical protein PK677_08975 [Acidiphilium sp.]|nr:hypothetical protein [Acidiphilium sp.]HQU23628.1 hypothetical protein [Acidiphilium sp.]
MNSDDTIRVRPPVGKSPPPQSPRSGHRKFALFVGVFFVVGVALIALSLVVLRRVRLPLADEKAIALNHPHYVMTFRLRADPLVLVVDCPTLHVQGLMFDRIAALIEKANAPRDRVLSWPELTEAATTAHQTIGTYYYGNDYSAHSLRRFFRIARRDHRKLNAQEKKLRTLLGRVGYLRRGANGAVISLPAAGTGKRVSMHARAVILRHEISHGAFFTLPFYRTYTKQFWTLILTQAERQDFRSFLGREGYDMSNQTLMMNETQAYLVFTRDDAFFTAAAVGLPQATIDQLRADYIAHMPHFWLKRLALEPLPR